MGSSKITMIRDIDENSVDFTIKVRLIRLWHFMDSQKKDQVFSVEMILLDEQGSRIYARLFNNCFSKFVKLLEEGGTYLITKPDTAANRSAFNYTDHTQRLTIRYGSTVTVCSNFEGSLYGFQFVDFHSINAQTCPKDSCFDVIGEISAYGQLDDKNPDKRRHTIRLQLTNLDGIRINVTLWGQLAYKMSDWLLTNITNTLRNVIIIQFGKLNVWNDEVTFSSHYDITRFYVNEDIEEIEQFRKDLIAAAGNQTSHSTISFLPSRATKNKQDFETIEDIKNISEIFQPEKDSVFVLIGKITGIRHDWSWYYNACTRCFTRVTETLVLNHTPDTPETISSKVVLTCKRKACSNGTVTQIPRYMIPIRVQDSTGNANLTLYNEDCTNLLNITVQELIHKQTELGISLNLFPDEINVLKGRKFAFMCKVSDYNVKKGSDVYGVEQLTDDPDLIKMLESKLKKNEPAQSDSFSRGPLDTHADSSKFDCISATGENVTPATVDKSTATSPLKVVSNDANINRNLQNVFDLDSYDDASATKQIPLLIPKKEK